MSGWNRRIGAWGEGMAVGYLSARGYRILGRNIRTPYGEIDILAETESNTVFVEVKTLTTAGDFNPEDQITSRKRGHLLSAAAHYAAEHDIDHWQIDVLAVQGRPPQQPAILHFENAVE